MLVADLACCHCSVRDMDINHVQNNVFKNDCVLLSCHVLCPVECKATVGLCPVECMATVGLCPVGCIATVDRSEVFPASLVASLGKFGADCLTLR